LAGRRECIQFLEFGIVDMDGSFPMSRYTLHLDSWFKSYGVFIDFSLATSRLSATVNAANSAQNCPKLPKSAQMPKNETLKFHQKSRFQYFSKQKNSMCRGGTRVCFQSLDFQSKNFSYAIFIVKKRPLYLNFSIPYCGK
jgi:hypothetical protein